MSGLSCGFVGLPNVGKSTLFNSLTRKGIPSENFPFCTIDPHVGIVNLPDPRLEKLSSLSKSKKLIYAPVTFVDIAGIVKGASKGEGLGNKFLSNIRETDAIIQVVRCFDNDDIVHVDGKVDPIADIEVINLELILADLENASNIHKNLQKKARTNKELQARLTVIEKVIKHLEEELPVRTLELTDDEKEQIKHDPFLTAKPILYAANVSEADLPTMENAYVEKVRAYAQKEGSDVIPICAKVEEDLTQFSDEEAKDLLVELGLEEPGLNRLIKRTFDMLGLLTYLTTGEVETRAWTIRQGSKAPEAAGKIHGDLQKGFIRAEVVSFDDMMQYGGRAGAKEAGKARSEGKEYIVQDGDVILFFHN